MSVRLNCTLNWATGRVRLLICTWSHWHTYVIQAKNTQAQTTLNQCHEIQFGMRTLYCVANEKKKKRKRALKWCSLCERRVILQPCGLKSSSKVSTCGFSFSREARQFLASFEPFQSFLSIPLKLTSNSVYNTISSPFFTSLQPTYSCLNLGKTRWNEWSFFLYFPLTFTKASSWWAGCQLWRSFIVFWTSTCHHCGKMWRSEAGWSRTPSAGC